MTSRAASKNDWRNRYASNEVLLKALCRAVVEGDGPAGAIPASAGRPCSECLAALDEELSPHEWGRHFVSEKHPFRGGAIPACAGQTPTPPACA